MQCSAVEVGHSNNVEDDKNGKNREVVNDPAISTIYNPKNCSPMPSITTPNPDVPTKKKTFLEHIKKISFSLKLGRKATDKGDAKKTHARLLYCTLLLLLVLLTGIACLVYFLNVGHSVQRDIIVDGEFQILNRRFDYQMLDKNSDAYSTLASNVTRELDRLFERSDVSEYYHYSEMLEVTPEMVIKCLVLFSNSENVNVGKIGLAFLRSLRLQHSHTWLGNYTINIQSIGFQIRGEEGVWGEWTDWKGCDSEKDYVATRTRLCLTRDTFQPTNIDRCLLIPGNKGDLDIMTCRIFKNNNSVNINNSSPSLDITTAEADSSHKYQI